MTYPFEKLAEEIASDPSLYEKAVCFSWTSRLKWECMGYSKTGKSIRFSRLLYGKDGLQQINKYVHPKTMVLVWESNK